MDDSVRQKEIGGGLDFAEICERASKCEISSIVDCNDDRFLAPDSMTEEIRAACRESGQQAPEGIAETASVIYNSLAKCYAGTIREIGQSRDRATTGYILWAAAPMRII